MAEQSFLNKLGMRFGILGSSAALAWAAPLSTGDYSTSCHTDAARIGMYFDRTAAAEKMGIIVGGQTGPLYTRSGTVVDAQFTGVVTIGDGSIASTLTLNGAAGTDRVVNLRTAGSNRWREYADSTAEGGGNVGSILTFQAFADDGVTNNFPLQFYRAGAPVGGFAATRSIVISTGSSGASLILTGNAATTRQLVFRTTQSPATNGARWLTIVNNSAESGSDAGSAWVLQAADDSGAVINTPITVTRAALGVVTLVRPTTQTGGALTGTQTLWSSTATWSNVATTFTAWKFNTTTTASAAGSLLCDLQVGSATRFNVTASTISSITIGAVTMTSADDGTATQCIIARNATLTAGIADGFSYIINTVAINGIFTVTRLNYFDLLNPTGAATITNATVFDFDASAGTHCCLDAGTTKTTPTAVSGWIKHNINGTVYFSNAYQSKTA